MATVTAKRTHTTAFASPSTSTSSSKKQAKEQTLASIFKPSAIKWITKTGSLHHIAYGSPTGSARPVLFDLDGTLVTGKKNWAWWDAGVPQRLRDLVKGGTAIYIITNQGWTTDNGVKAWESKIEGVLRALDVPCTVLAATGYDWKRKPMPGLWQVLKDVNKVDIDESAVFYVGDAAGRQGDHSACDVQWAENVGIDFRTPEEYFHGASAPPRTPHGFDLRAALAMKQIDVYIGPLFAPANTPLVPSPAHTELVVFVGCMGSGKSTFFRQHLEPFGYVWVNNDTLKGMEKCRKAADDALASGQSVVIDNTSPSEDARAPYIEIARKHRVPARAFHFDVAERLGWHNNLFRAFAPESQRPKPYPLIPPSGYVRYASTFRKPTETEGFAEVKTIYPRFVQPTPEAQRQYEMHLSLGGMYTTIEQGPAIRVAGKPQDYNRSWKKGR